MICSSSPELVGITNAANAPKKCVRFTKYATLRVFTRSKKEEDLWYPASQTQEFDKQADQCAENVLKSHQAMAKEYIRNSFEVDKSNIKFTGVENIVGLEHLLDENVLNMLCICCSLTRHRVLKEQYRQRRTGETNIELLAEYSKRSSMFSVLWRRRIARMNADADCDLAF